MKDYLLATVAIIASWSVLSFAGAERTDSPLTEEIWQYYQYKNQFNKTHNTTLEEEQQRFSAFRENLNTINDSNNRQSDATYKQGLNHLSDLSRDEFLARMIIKNATYIDDRNQVKSNTSWLQLDNGFEAPPFVDYSNDSRRVGPIRDQGSCASGWAIATTGLIEGREIRNRTYEVIPLSVQNILDCDQYDNGCSGGDVECALTAIQDEGGLNTEQSYPYEARDTDRCRYDKHNPFVTTMYIRSITNLVSGNESMLAETVARYGPVAVGLDGSLSSFQNYKSGVYFDSECKNHTINHHMLVVGYGTSENGQDYWKLKNSWTTNWGMSGYMLLARNKNNHCGVATKATVVQISN